MNADSLIGSLSEEDLKTILRGQGQDSSGTEDDLRKKVRDLSQRLSWMFLLISVPKESLQRVCGSNGLRSDLTKDELIDQIVRSLQKAASKGTPLRDYGSPWQRWTTGGRDRR
jgi:hypothetical protein